MEGLTLVLARQVETLDVGLTTVIDEATLIPVEETVNAQWEEFIIVRQLQLQLSGLLRRVSVVALFSALTLN